MRKTGTICGDRGEEKREGLKRGEIIGESVGGWGLGKENEGKKELIEETLRGKCGKLWESQRVGKRGK